MKSITKQVEQLVGIKSVLPAHLVDEGMPVVLRGFANDWQSVIKAGSDNQNLIEYLRHLGHSKIHRELSAFRGSGACQGRYYYNDSMTGFNFQLVTMSLGRWLDKMNESDCLDCHLYAGSTSVEGYFPGFSAENSVDLGAVAPLVSFWMGNQSRIAAHFDAPENLICVVTGRRRFTLFPPDQLGNLYVGPIEFNPAGQPISMVDFSNPDFDRFPRFREAMETAQVTVLEPGDALYLPSLWWHHVETLDPLNLMINYWWHPAPSLIGNPLHALMHAILNFQELPARHRQAWRHLFDHFVFNSHETDFSHIPIKHLGAMGEIDAATRQEVQQKMIKILQNNMTT